MPSGIFNKKVPAMLRGQLAKAAVGTFFLKIALVGLNFILSVLLARVLKVDAYGTYSYIVAWLVILGVPSELGLRTILSKEIPKLSSSSNWGLIHGLLRWSNQIALIVSIAIVVFCGLCVPVLIPDESVVGFWIGLTFLPLSTLTALRQGSMRGFHSVALGQVSENFIQPLTFIASLSIVSHFLAGGISIVWVMILRGISVSISFLFGVVLLLKTIPRSVFSAPPDYALEKWVKNLFPFTVISGCFVICSRADAVMLGFMQDSEAVGIYTVASRGADFVIFALGAVSMSIGPRIAEFHAKGDMQKVRSIAIKGSRAVLYVSIPIAISLLLFGNYFLLLFGEEFVKGSTALKILCLGQVANVSAGSAGVLLDMTGHQKQSAFGIGISAVINVILNALMIPQFGVEGAAVSTAASLAIRNAYFVIVVRRKLGIFCTPLVKL